MLKSNHLLELNIGIDLKREDNKTTTRQLNAIIFRVGMCALINSCPLHFVCICVS